MYNCAHRICLFTDLSAMISQELKRARESAELSKVKQAEYDRSAHVRPWDKGKGVLLLKQWSCNNSNRSSQLLNCFRKERDNWRMRDVLTLRHQVATMRLHQLLSMRNMRTFNDTEVVSCITLHLHVMCKSIVFGHVRLCIYQQVPHK